MATSYRPEEQGSWDDQPKSTESAPDADAETRIDPDTTDPGTPGGTGTDPETRRDAGTSIDSGDAPTRAEPLRDDLASSRTTAGTAATPAPAASAEQAEATTRIPAHSPAETTVDDDAHRAGTTSDVATTQDVAQEERREAAAQLGVARSRNRFSTDIGLLILRVMNIVMILHGIAKVTNYSAFRQTVASNSFGALAPDLFAIMVVAGQLALPIAIAVGLFTRIAGLLQAIMMGIIWVLFPLAAGLIDPDTGGINGESAFLFVAIGLTLFFTGPGRISLDQLIFGKGAERRASRRAAKKVS